MARSMTIDLVDGNDARQTADGWEFTRTAVVRGLTGAAVVQMVEAVTAVPGLPRIGEPHPAYPAARLQERQPAAEGGGVVRVRLIYRTPTGGQAPQDKKKTTVEIRAGLSSQAVDKDIKGRDMVVEYRDKQNVVHQQPVVADIGLPSVVLVFRRQETGSPGQKAVAYVGKVNAGSWQGFAEAHWRCNAITGISEDGVTYDVTYEFELRPTKYGWWWTGIYIDPEIGRAPVDLKWGTGKKNYEVYEEADFAGLGL